MEEFFFDVVRDLNIEIMYDGDRVLRIYDDVLFFEEDNSCFLSKIQEEEFDEYDVFFLYLEVLLGVFDNQIGKSFF